MHEGIDRLAHLLKTGHAGVRQSPQLAVTRGSDETVVVLPTERPQFYDVAGQHHRVSHRHYDTGLRCGRAGNAYGMTIKRLLAQSTVDDLAVAKDWYARVLGRQPDARPMAGLVEWHLADTFGVQVWAESDQAGHSAMVLDESDLDALVARLDEAGISHDGPQDVTSSRILSLVDPDGNRIVFTGAFA